jgi:hypothetical protein
MCKPQAPTSTNPTARCTLEGQWLRHVILRERSARNLLTYSVINPRLSVSLSSRHQVPPLVDRTISQTPRGCKGLYTPLACTLSMAISAHKGSSVPDVYLTTVELIGEMLERASVPVSRNWLLGQLKAKGHSTTRQRLNRALGHYARLGVVVEGSKGVQWTYSDSDSLRRASVLGREI